MHSWYTAFGNCRCAEHHELVRSLAWLAAPVGGATVGFIGGSYGAQQLHLAKQLVALPCALVAAWCASTLNSRGYGWLSDMLDRRADAAAVIACPTAEDKERVITYLQEVTKQHDDSAQAEQEYQLFCVNAYDVAQSNLCSFITIHIQFPVPWLSSSDEIKRKLQQRITYLERALQP